MFKDIFKFKIYKQKFIRLWFIFVIVIFLAIIVSIKFFLFSWVRDFDMRSQKAFNGMEERLRTATSLIDISMSNIYSNISLHKDVEDFIYSKSMDEYLKRRNITSISNERQIASYTNEMNNLFIISKPYISTVSIHYEGYVNYISSVGLEDKYKKDSNSLNCKFNIPESTFESYYNKKNNLNVSHTFTFEDENGISQKAEMVFWLDEQSILLRMLSYNIGAIGIQSNAKEETSPIWIDNTTYSDNQINLWFDEMEKYEKQRGSFSTGLVNVVNYSKFDSSQVKFTFICMIDDFTLLKDNLPITIFVITLIVLVSIIALVFTITSLHYDAIFMNQILHIIKNVKDGKFKIDKNYYKEHLYEKNEYGIIIRELEKMSISLKNYIEKEYEFTIKQRESEMLALQYQINPHFLYNTLEEIRAQALISNDTITADCIANLGSLYRGIIRKPSEITLGEELELLEDYLKIMTLKYPKNFFYQFDVEDKIKDIMTVKFWMQPLVENFFVHGFDLKCEYNMIIIKGYSLGSNIIIEITDNGVTLSEEQLEELNNRIVNTKELKTSSIGLPNVYTRLKIFYGSRFDMKIANNSQQAGINTIVKIPVKKVD